jgi:hypothetical protein
MKNEKMTRSWGVAAAMTAIVICIAAAGISVWSAAQTGQNPAKNAPVTIQWQTQSDLEARFTTKIIEDNKFLKGQLEHLAGLSELPDLDQWQKQFGGHFLKVPQLWTNGKLYKGWKEVLPALHEIVRRSKDIEINFAWAMIEYVPYDKEKNLPAAEDIDFLIKIKVAFSASPGDNLLEGELSHRRICLIEP